MDGLGWLARDTIIELVNLTIFKIQVHGGGEGCFSEYLCLHRSLIGVGRLGYFFYFTF